MESINTNIFRHKGYISFNEEQFWQQLNVSVAR
jgi:hypothetical protein